MKSHIDYVVPIYESILSDAIRRWPYDVHSIEKDLSYLRRASKERGLSFFTITLPDWGKAIDRSLDLGCLLGGSTPFGVPTDRNKRPILFGTFINRIFDHIGFVKADACVDSVLYVRQLLYAFKKYRLECPPSKVKETLDEFFSIEAQLPPSYPDTWDSECPIWTARVGHPLGGTRSTDQQTLPGLDLDTSPDLDWNDLRALCKRIIHQEFGQPDWWELEPKHGPGVVSEPKGSFISKYEFPHWPRKLENWFPFDWFGSGSLESGLNDLIPSDREPPSRLIAVPKTQKGPRLIAAEPTAHQWMQQSIWRWLEGRIEKSAMLANSIRFRDQSLSRDRALAASVDGELATVDLSSASDRLSTRLVEYVFQGSPILDGLHACRTRALVQDISLTHPKMVVLRKFAPMGSACTFPVQTIVFTILSYWAVCLTEGLDWRKPGVLEGVSRRVTVFGDDIILPVQSYETIERVLHACGLKVNNHKSYFGKSFRESCGMDAYNGVDVTPAYILEAYDGSPSSMATTIESSNNFHKHGFWITAEEIVNQLPDKERKLILVTSGEEGGLGLFSFCGGSTEHLRSKYDRNLQREYSSALTVTSKVTKSQGRGISSLTQYFTERPSPMLPWSSGQVGVVRLRKSRTKVYR